MEVDGICSNENSAYIPIVDFASYNTDDKLNLSKAICDTLRTAGFLYVKNHQIPDDIVQNVFQKSLSFFTLPLEEKLKHERPANSYKSDTGYNRIGLEKLNPSSKIEIREAFDVHANAIPDISSVPDFVEALLKLDRSMRDLAIKILHCIGIGLDLEDELFFVKNHKAVGDTKQEWPAGNLFRTLYYPKYQVTEDTPGDGIVRAGTHSDYGSLTLLFQDDVGGLEIESGEKGVFVPAVPVPGAVLVNIGDLLAMWTSDEFRATKHRVLLNDRNKGSRARQSIVMFIHPDGDTMIEALPGRPTFPPVRTEDHIISRFAATY